MKITILLMRRGKYEQVYAHTNLGISFSCTLKVPFSAMSFRIMIPVRACLKYLVMRCHSELYAHLNKLGRARKFE